MKSEKIPYVPKDMNPANVPEARAIEDFWAILKRDYTRMDGVLKQQMSLKIGLQLVSEILM